MTVLITRRTSAGIEVANASVKPRNRGACLRQLQVQTQANKNVTLLRKRRSNKLRVPILEQVPRDDRMLRSHLYLRNQLLK